MSDWFTAVLFSLPLVLLALRDWRVAARVRRAARIKPQIPFLSRASSILDAIVVVAFVCAALGVQSVVFNVNGLRLIPSPLPALMLYAATILLSLAVHRLGRTTERRLEDDEWAQSR